MSHCELLHESQAKRGLTFLCGEVQTRGAGRHPCCCVNKSTRRQRRERQWRKERHQIDSPCLVNDFSHIYLLLSVAFVHIFTPSHLHILPSSHPHTSTYTYHVTPSHLHIYLPYTSSHPHTLTPAHIPTMPPPFILTPSHLHVHKYTYHATPSHPHTCTYTPTPLTELSVSDKCPSEADSDKSDVEEAEDVCPICLNELDEGEDLLVCSGCHNHLHQHCMDICEW